MKILVTGGTGFTGQRVLALFKERCEVRCFVRPGSDMRKIEKFNYEIVSGDTADLASLKKAMTGCDTLVNLVSLGSGYGPGIVRMAEEAGIKRSVFFSTTALFTQLKADSKQLRAQAEDCIKESGLDWTILRPTMIYGAPDDRNMIRLIRFLDRFPVMPVFGSGEYMQQPVWVEDAAGAVVAVLENKITIGKAFNISGKFPHTFNEIIDLTAGALGKKVMKVHLPLKIAFYAARIQERLSSKPFLKAEQILRLAEHKAFDWSAAEEAFGFNPVSFHEGITEDVRLYRLEGSKKHHFGEQK